MTLSDEVRRTMTKPSMRMIYIACPFSLGDNATNIRISMDAAARILSLGALPFNPLLLNFHFIVHNLPYDEIIQICLGYVERCDAIFRISGESKGADTEMEHAAKCGLPHFRAIGQLELWLNSQK